MTRFPGQMRQEFPRGQAGVYRIKVRKPDVGNLIILGLSFDDDGSIQRNCASSPKWRRGMFGSSLENGQMVD